MFTQCPQCETVFHITIEQLQAHGGLVRCGQCDHVFNADQRLFDEIPAKPVAKPTAAKKARAAGNVKAKSAKPKPASEAPEHNPSRSPKKPTPEDVTDEVEAAPAPWVAPTYEPLKESAGEHTAEQLVPRSASRRFSFLWIVGILLLSVVFAAQATYFYRDQLAAFPELRPYLVELCAEIGCTLQPPYQASRIELVQPTNIAPHPRYANALRLRATLVNRADRPQPPPLMQVTLTDSAGRVLSRRTFAPVQYLEQRAAANNDMSPHLAISAVLDLTNPDGKAVGYQIDFYAPPID